MKTTLVRFHNMERHRKFQLLITGGLAASIFFAAIDPAYSLWSAATNVAASLIWLWE